MTQKNIRGNTSITLSEETDKYYGASIDVSKKEKRNQESFVPPVKDDGEIILDASAAYGQYLDIVGTIRNDYELITRYREMLLQPEVESAIDDIVNESMVTENDNDPVTINLDKSNLSDSIKTKIIAEFEIICRLLDIKARGYEVFRKWYTDGRLFYHLIVDPKHPKNGIIEARYIDPRQITKVIEVERHQDRDVGLHLMTRGDEYFVFNPSGIKTQGVGFPQTQQVTGIKISKDAIAYAHSGIIDKHNKTVYSHLHKALKSLNQLRMMEDAVIIYRITRAPERRIFYVDVGNLPRTKAEEYLRTVMNKYKNKLYYDVQTGETKDDRRHLAMLEDFWMPRREGSTGTEIDTLPGGQNLGEMEDVEYFQKKLYRSLNVPFSRWNQPENGFNMGKAAEITRDELKFTKFIYRIRRRFGDIFHQILSKQLILKNIIRDEAEWEQIKNGIYYQFASDSYFTESKEQEILKERLDILNTMDNYVGTYFSKEYIRKHVLKQSDEEINRLNSEMKSDAPVQNDDDDDDSDSWNNN